MSAGLKASSLLPRFQAVLSKWPVDPQRNYIAPQHAKKAESFPNRDLGLYLHMMSERVASDKIDYQFAEKELVAAERLTKGDYFEKFKRASEGGMRSALSVEEIRAIMNDPYSTQAQNALTKERFELKFKFWSK